MFFCCTVHMYVRHHHRSLPTADRRGCPGISGVPTNQAFNQPANQTTEVPTNRGPASLIQSSVSCIEAFVLQKGYMRSSGASNLPSRRRKEKKTSHVIPRRDRDHIFPPSATPTLLLTSAVPTRFASARNAHIDHHALARIIRAQSPSQDLQVSWQ